MNCTSEDKYTREDGRCCDRCAAGQYIISECDQTKITKCAGCKHGTYTATKNHIKKCLVCKDCSSINNQRKVKNCTAREDTVCECVKGLYCDDDRCDHCKQLTHCPLGEGVKVQATRTNDTICAPCQDRTYSNVSDFHSACKTHTRCEDIGREVKTPGTPRTDAICGNFKSNCPWMLPTGLWSGLLLTALILFGVICWRSKRKSYKADPSVAVSLVEMVPAAPVTQLDLSLPIKELDGHCQETCVMEGCKIPLFNPDDSVVICDTQEHLDNSAPIIPLKVSVSFIESNHINGSAAYRTGSFQRTYSEPQEDEWCGT
ncbi:tumor necrosis factor receptor superfamily member 5 isoform X2 [Anoplopoma fimbria]|uniref:tumor necrosis factor receptor superfamily member 5 isoform X2 n=1 Tax=Anoplopoma fimbria TaxID=229290 RepID=UPI0023ED919A|nr:tumor necrosis factor receptor superfamily member 5 isoform X2 [Anoplopoma fimbria]